MRDPRIDRLLLRRDETNARGVPTRVADLAGKVSSLLVEIEKLRAEIEVQSRQVMALAAKESSIKKSLQQRSQRVAMVDGSNALALDAQSAQLVGDEPDAEFAQERLETVAANLKARRLSVQRTQDLIATRITTVQRMLDLFTRIEDGTATAVGSTGSGGTQRKVRRVRRIRRRK